MIQLEVTIRLLEALEFAIESLQQKLPDQEHKLALWTMRSIVRSIRASVGIDNRDGSEHNAKCIQIDTARLAAEARKTLRKKGLL